MEMTAAGGPVCRLFGRMEVWSRNGTRVEFLSERSKQLFAVLALEKGGLVSRNVLVARLWADAPEDRLRHCLSTEVWRLRCALARAGEDASRWIKARPEGLCLSRDQEVWIDVEAFDLCVKSASPPDPAIAFERVEQLYRGDLLYDVSNDWCLPLREAYRNRFLAYLEALLITAKLRSDWQEAIRISRRILIEDSFLEHVHREMMHCQAMMGDRAAALRHYEKLQIEFRQELGVSPSVDITALYNSLRSDGGQQADVTAPVTISQDLERQLALIQQHLDQLTQEIREFASHVRSGLRLR